MHSGARVVAVVEDESAMVVSKVDLLMSVK